MTKDSLNTNDKNYYKRLKMLESVFDNAQVGIIVSGREKNISYNNKELTRIFVYDINDVMSKDFFKSFFPKEVHSLLHPDEREMIMKRAVKRVNDALEGQSYEHKGLKKDGSTIYIEVSVTRTIYNNEPVGFAFIRDVTDRKKIEIELKKSKAEAERANGAKSEFLANMR